MRVTSHQPRGLRDYTNAPFEVFVALFTLLPFLALAHFYAELPGRVPLFMRLNGEVAVWAEKSLVSVFRVPLMALDTQLVCLLAKYGAVQSAAGAAPEYDGGREEYRRQYARLNAAVWDSLRLLVAVKMSAASLDTVFLGVERFGFLSRPAFAVTAAAAALSVVASLVYGYRLLALKRRAGAGLEESGGQHPVDARRVYGGLIYFDPSDPAMFVSKYALNFGNKWAWAFVACVVAYPLLVFAPA